MTGAATIVAPASGPPPSAVVMIRLSGPATRHVLGALGCLAPLATPRRLVRVTVTSRAGDPLDDALAVWFPGPRSYTGEDAAELHCHGGRATLEALVQALTAFADVRLAEPGEFSRRAFDNGKLDLAAVEGLGDLIAAETEAQRKQAMRQLSGVLGRRCEAWSRCLTDALAHMEATIDFSDEDLPDTLDADARRVIGTVRAELADALDDSGIGERLRGGLVVAIAGAPNAGKSSLLNALARRDAAIVTDRAGTTRDIIEVAASLGGYPVSLVDTAGLRDSDDPVEQEGVCRARAAVDRADIRLLVLDGHTWPALDRESQDLLDGPDTLPLISKADLGIRQPGNLLTVSATHGTGLAALERQLATMAAQRLGGSETALITRARHREALTRAHDALGRALDSRAAELWAEDLRHALGALGRIAGRVDVEDLLDVIFRDFCIGK